jgi:hypothetical protein
METEDVIPVYFVDERFPSLPHQLDEFGADKLSRFRGFVRVPTLSVANGCHRRIL